MTRLSHWMSWTRFYRIYCHIWNRCNRKENCNYKHYGWKWIKNLWNSFEDFRDDMYKEYLKLADEIWEDKVSIDRKKNNKDYCKSNCRWVNLKEQQENRDNNRYITYKWETHHLRKWSRLLWVSDNVLRNRIVTLKWDINRAFETEVISRK